MRIDDKITLVMDVYNDQNLNGGKRYLDLHLPNGQALPILEGMQP